MNAMIATQVILGMSLFTAIILVLVFIILAARSRLVASGSVQVIVNDERELAMPVGGKLMQGLADADLFVPSACGGGGTCAQCRCRVTDGGGSILSTEEGHFTRGEISEDWRLSCQVAVKQDMRIHVPEGDPPAQRFLLLGLVHLTHTTFANLGCDLEMSYRFTNHPQTSPSNFALRRSNFEWPIPPSPILAVISK